MTQRKNISEKVTVIGLGLMGATLARLLINKGYSVTVWNRTPEKAEPLVREGAVLASSVAEAISASPFVVVSVFDYQATNEIFNSDDVVSALPGKTIIQLTTGSPQEARDGKNWARQQGADYVDGAIMAVPNQMGKPDTIILVSGAPEAFQKSEQILKIFGGKITNLGGEIGAASAMDLALLSYTYGAALGFFHGARISESENIPVDSFGALVADFSPTVGEFMKYEGEVIKREEYAATESPIRISIEAVERMLQTAQESGINTEFPIFAAGIFRQAKAAGYENEELAALIKVFRRQANAEAVQGGKNV